MQTGLRDMEWKFLPIGPQSFPRRLAAGLTITFLWLLSGIAHLHASKDHAAPNPGFVTELAASIEDVLQALQEVLEDQTIHGTQVFDREPTLTGAVIVGSTALFEPWKGEGKVFYKIRTNAIAPRHFLQSADQGTIAARYEVTSVSPARTRLRIDAVFVEPAHRAVDSSDGTVESSEYTAIQDHLQPLQFAEQEATDQQQRRESIDLA